MIHFQLPWLLAALPAPWFVWRISRPLHQKRDAALRVPFFAALASFAPTRAGAPKSNRRRLTLASLAWALLVLAAAQPQWLGDPLPLPIRGRDLMLAIDLSGSMEIPDFDINGKQTTRLSVVKATASQFVRRREGDRIGLILFGTQSYLQTPLTFDRKTVAAQLEDATIGLAGKETAIGDAIGLAVKRLRDQPAESRVLVLMTDGANTAGEVAPLKATELAKSAGLRIYTIGIGADSIRLPGPSLFGPQVVNPSADLDEKLLTQIAKLTGGSYFRAKNTDGLEEIYHQLDKLEPVSGDTQVMRPRHTLFHWPLSLAVFLTLALLAEPILKSRRRLTAAKPSRAEAKP